jgi:hypothetical protein
MIKIKIKLKIVANQNLNRLRKNLIRMKSVKTQNLGLEDLTTALVSMGLYRNQQHVALLDGSNNHRNCDL